MDNSTELVPQKITSTKETRVTVKKYFDGKRCLGERQSLAMVAHHQYSLSIAELSAACGCEPKQVRGYLKKNVKPGAKITNRILRAIELYKRFRQDLSMIPLTTPNPHSILTNIPDNIPITEQTGEPKEAV